MEKSEKSEKSIEKKLEKVNWNLCQAEILSKQVEKRGIYGGKSGENVHIVHEMLVQNW